MQPLTVGTDYVSSSRIRRLIEKGDVGQRFLDDQLTADPIGFVIDRLADLRALLIDSGAGDLADAVDYDEVGRTLPAIRASIEASFEAAGATA